MQTRQPNLGRRGDPAAPAGQGGAADASLADRRRRVFAASDIGQAWIALQVAEARHTHAAVDYNGAAGRLGRVTAPPRPAGNANLEFLGQIVDWAAADAIRTELAERDMARAAHIAGRTDP